MRRILKIAAVSVAYIVFTRRIYELGWEDGWAYREDNP